MKISMDGVWDRTRTGMDVHRRALTAIGVLALFAPLAIEGVLAPLQTQGPALAGVVLVLSIACSIAILWGYAAIVALMVRGEASAADARRTATRRLLALIGIALVALIGVGLLMLPIWIAAGAAGISMSGAGAAGAISPGLVAFVMLYSVLLVVALIWLGSRLALVYPVAVEERRGLNAFARSWRLTRGIAWKIIGLTAMFTVVLLVSITAARFVFGTIFALVAGGDGAITLASALTAIVVAIVTAVWSVVAIAFAAELYRTARDRHEAQPVRA